MFYSPSIPRGAGVNGFGHNIIVNGREDVKEEGIYVV
jgi:hypothetical protein